MSFSAKFKNVFRWGVAVSAFLFIIWVLALNFMFPMRHAGLINTYANAYGVEGSLVRAVIWTESKFDRRAVSSAGAVGLMQLMPKTAEWCAGLTGEEYSYDRLFEADFNIKLGTFYLGYLIDKYGEKDALAAYNAGEGNLLLWQNELQGKILFKETRDFVKRVGAANKVYKFKSL